MLPYHCIITTALPMHCHLVTKSTIACQSNKWRKHARSSDHSHSPRISVYFSKRQSMIFSIGEKHSLSHNLKISWTLNKKLNYPRNNLASQLSTCTKTVFCSLLARLPASPQPLHPHSDLTKGIAAIARGPPSSFARCFLVSTSCAQNQRRIKRPSEQAGPLKAALSSEGGQRKGLNTLIGEWLATLHYEAKLFASKKRAD